MYCGGCGKEVAANAKFCGNCGQPISSRSFCTNCGTPNANNTEYCIKCGAQLSRTQGAQGHNITPPPYATSAQNADPSKYNEAPPHTSPSVRPVTKPKPVQSEFKSITKPIARTNLKSSRSRLATAVLALLFGQLGVHRFYAGKKVIGMIQLLLAIAGYITLVFSTTGYILLGVVGIWVLIDFILIQAGKFKDGEGLLIK